MLSTQHNRRFVARLPSLCSHRAAFALARWHRHFPAVLCDSSALSLTRTITANGQQPVSRRQGILSRRLAACASRAKLLQNYPLRFFSLTRGPGPGLSAAARPPNRSRSSEGETEQHSCAPLAAQRRAERQRTEQSAGQFPASSCALWPAAVRCSARAFPRLANFPNAPSLRASFAEGAATAAATMHSRDATTQQQARWSIPERAAEERRPFSVPILFGALFSAHHCFSPNLRCCAIVKVTLAAHVPGPYTITDVCNRKYPRIGSPQNRRAAQA